MQGSRTGLVRACVEVEKGSGRIPDPGSRIPESTGPTAVEFKEVKCNFFPPFSLSLLVRETMKIQILPHSGATFYGA